MDFNLNNAALSAATSSSCKQYEKVLSQDNKKKTKIKRNVNFLISLSKIMNNNKNKTGKGEQ